MTISASALTAAVALFCVLSAARVARAAPLDEYAQQWAEQAELSASWRLERGDEVLAEGSRGFVRAGSGQPITSDTVFFIGSITKQFTAAAVLKLIEQGKLELGGRAASYFPELTQGALERGGVSCTIEHLLSHTCGLPRDPGRASTLADTLLEPAAAARLLEEVQGTELASEPGAKFEYSNLGYALLGVLVQRASGKSYEQYLDEQFWTPLGMTHTGVRLRDGLVLARGQAGLLVGWVDAADWFFMDVDAVQRHGAEGNIYSTPRDLAVWTRALHHGKVLQPASYAELVRPRLEDYGLGTVIKDDAIGKLIHHNGALSPQGYASQLAYMPEHDLTAVVLSNRPLESALAMPFTGALLRKASGQEETTPKTQPRTRLLLGSLFLTSKLLFSLVSLWALIRLVRQPERLDRESWWIDYHSYALALGFLLFMFRSRPFEPLMLVWLALLLAGLYKSHWWRLPRWQRGRGIKPYVGLALRASLLLGILLYATQPVLVGFGALLVVEAALVVALAAKGAREQSVSPG